LPKQEYIAMWRQLLTVGALGLIVVATNAAPAAAAYGAFAHDDDAHRYGYSWNQETEHAADEAALKGCKTDKCKVVFRTGPKICGAIALTADDKVWGARHEITALLPSWPQSRTARNAARVSARFALQSVIGTLPVFLRSR
jgi:Domain of unknown function (DUF4189)